MQDNELLQPSFMKIICLAFVFAGTAGVAWLLRSNRMITRRSFCSAFLNSGVGGAIVCSMWLKTYQDNVWFLLGVCGLIGVGGIETIEFMRKTFHGVMVKYVQTVYDVTAESAKKGEVEISDD